jgi:hypothetical protein
LGLALKQANVLLRPDTRYGRYRGQLSCKHLQG